MPLPFSLRSRTIWSSGLSLLVLLAGCSGGSDAPTPPTPPPSAPVVARVEVAPATGSVETGAVLSLTATARAKDGTALNRSFNWTSSDPTKATVSASGVVTGVGAGAVQIQASTDGVSGSATIEVRPVAVAQVALTAAATSIAVDATTALTVILRDGAGRTLSGREVRFASSAPAVATVSADGIVTGVSAGSATITATSEGKSATLTLTVTPRLAEWTVMVFLAGDNSLAKHAVDDIDEMESVGSTRDVQVVMQAEWSSGVLQQAGIASPSGVNRPNWNTFRYAVPTAGAAPAVRGVNGAALDIGNRDMTSPQELREFVAWARETAPAKRYLLVLWNHGNGPSGLLADETSRPGQLMSLAQLRSALTGTAPVDIIDFDMCLMGAYETVAALRGVARTAVFSSDVIPGEGTDYRELLRALQAGAQATTCDVAGRLVDAFFAGYATNPRPSLTQSAVNLERADALVAATAALAAEMRGRLPTALGTIAQAAGRAQRFEQPYLKDYLNVLDSLRLRTEDASWRSRIDAVSSALRDPQFLIRSRSRTGTGFATPNLQRASGLSILWPGSGSDEALPSAGDGSFSAYSASTGTDSWSGFLSVYLANFTAKPTVDLGLLPLQGALLWEDADRIARAEVDLLVFEPTLVPGLWDIYAPFLGTVSANGQFSPDSYTAQIPMEIWTARRFVTRGIYFFAAWLAEDPQNRQPAVNLASRRGYNGAYTPVFDAAARPRLRRGRNWLEDPALSFEQVLNGAYSDIRVIGSWDSGAASAGALAAATVDEADKTLRPRITPAQRETLARLALRRRMAPR